MGSVFSSALKIAIASSLCGCLAALDFDDISGGVPPTPESVWRFDETSGTEAADERGARVATLFVVDGSPAWSAGRRGGALAFDGGRGFARVAALSESTFPRRGTLSFWTKRSGDVTSGRRALFAANRAPRPALELALEGARLYFAREGSTEALYVGDVDFGGWVLVAATWDVDQKRAAVYVRSEARASIYAEGGVADGLSVDGASFEIQHPSGVVDDMKLYGRRLTRSELDAVE